MAAQPINTLLAHKAINLATELSNSEKRVAAAIIDHFNRRTGQCDPSLDCIAELIRMNRRTVIRATKRLQELGFMRRVKHGGKFHRNSYEPIWSRFLQVETEWTGRRTARRARFGAPKMSPCGSQTRHLDGDKADTQTFPIKSLKETSVDEVHSKTTNAPLRSNDEKGLSKKVDTDLNPHRHINRLSSRSSVPRSGIAARDAAERRWNIELLDRCRDQTVLYGSIVEAMDENLLIATTDAEFRCQGSGLSYLMSELFARDATLKQLAESNSATPNDESG